MSDPPMTIDKIKGVLIVLIVVGHNFLITSAVPGLYRILYCFHVGGFFLLSACLSRHPSDGRKLADKSFRYYVPYALFLTLYSIVFSLMVAGGRNPADTLRDYVASLVVPTADSIKSASGVLMLWFLPSLICFTVFDLLQRRLGPWTGMLITAVCHASIGCLPREWFAGVPWFMPAAGFMLFPAAVARELWMREARIARFVPAFFLALLFGGWVWKAGYFCDLSLNAVPGIDSPLHLLAVDGFLLSAFFAICGLPLPRTAERVFALLGRESLSIYLFHTLVFYALLKLRPQSVLGEWAGGVVVATATIAIAWSLGRLISRLPRLRGIVFPADRRQFLASLMNLKRA
ncbi:MAG: hypothetical protein RLZZ326_3953 [Planctomycetota bacterium]